MLALIPETSQDSLHRAPVVTPLSERQSTQSRLTGCLKITLACSLGPGDHRFGFSADAGSSDNSYCPTIGGRLRMCHCRIPKDEKGSA